jgi:membrane-associated phospholipid phosphatase
VVRRPLLIALLCVAVGAVVYLAAMDVSAVREADLRTLEGFMGLWSLPGASHAADFVGLFDPVPYAVLVLGVAASGFFTGRVRAGLIASGAMVCATASSQILKPLLAVQRDFPPGHYMDAASWPSGHTTSVMGFALALAIIAAPRYRPLVAAIGGLLTVATVYSLLILGSHYPSDVIGGLLLASAWFSAATILLREDVRLRSLYAPGLAGAVFAAGVVLVVVTRPESAVSYAAEHTTFVFGALAVAAVALLLSGSVLAPTAAPRRPRAGSPRG